MSESVSALSSLIMLDRYRIYSEHRQTEVYISEPDDYVIQVMCDFADRITNDAVNDVHLWELLERVFERRVERE